MHHDADSLSDPPAGEPLPLRPTLRQRLLRRLAIYGTLYACLVMIGWLFNITDNVILVPSTTPIPTADARAHRVPYARGEVEVWIARPREMSRDAEPLAFVLEFTGNATRAEEIAGASAWIWGRRPVEVWAMNYPGYGGSTGPARLRSAAQAALATHDAVRAIAGNRPIFVVGNSLGTAVALHVAAQRPEVAGLLLTNPPPLRQLIRGRFGWWNLWLAAGPISVGVPAEFDSVANARRVSVPAAFVTSAADEVVPLAYQQLVVRAYAGEKHVLLREDRMHNDPIDGSDEEWLLAQVEWLWQQSNATTQHAD